MNYWEQRAIARENYTDEIVNSYNKELIQNFELAQKQIQTTMNEYYLQYMKNNELTYAEMQQALSTKELKKFRSTLEEFKAMAENSFGTYNKELNNMSIRTRVTRLQALESEIKGRLDILYGKNQYTTERCLKHVYNEQYLRGLYDIDVYTNTLHSFAAISDTEINEMLRYPYGGASFSERIWKQQVDLTSKLKQTFIQNSILGKDPFDTAEEVAKMFKTKTYEAYRLIYTESAFVTERACMKAYLNDGIDKYQIVATLDTHTSEICREKDGMIIDVKDAVQGLNYPPFHPFCRTTTVPYLEVLEPLTDDEISKDTRTRISRDINGNERFVPYTFNYKEWLKTTPLKDIIGETTADTENGHIKISDISLHTYIRAVQRDITSNMIVECLKSPEFTSKIITDKDNRLAINFYSKDAMVTVNPDSGKIVSVRKLSNKSFEKNKKRLEKECMIWS